MNDLSSNGEKLSTVPDASTSDVSPAYNVHCQVFSSCADVSYAIVKLFVNKHPKKDIYATSLDAPDAMPYEDIKSIKSTEFVEASKAFCTAFIAALLTAS